jgi:hypothetical protein
MPLIWAILLFFQESNGKMSVGDEIVVIGDLQVCGSNYQDICDLMRNLPETLSLEIKRPVSGMNLENLLDRRM